MIVVSVIEGFGVLGDDFSGLWSQLGFGLLIGYILNLNFHGGNRSGLNYQVDSY